MLICCCRHFDHLEKFIAPLATFFVTMTKKKLRIISRNRVIISWNTCKCQRILKSLNRFSITMVEKQRGWKNGTDVQLDNDSVLKTGHAHEESCYLVFEGKSFWCEGKFCGRKLKLNFIDFPVTRENFLVKICDVEGFKKKNKWKFLGSVEYRWRKKNGWSWWD